MKKKKKRTFSFSTFGAAATSIAGFALAAQFAMTFLSDNTVARISLAFLLGAVVASLIAWLIVSD